MKADEWFTLWMTLLAGVLTLGGVWIGAALALSGQRRAARAEQQRLAAAHLARAVQETIFRLDPTDPASKIAAVTAAQFLARALYDPMVWVLDDHSFVHGALAMARELAETGADPAIMSYLSRLHQALVNRATDAPYELPGWGEWKLRSE